MIQLTFLVVGDQSFGDGLADGYKNNKTGHMVKKIYLQVFN